MHFRLRHPHTLYPLETRDTVYDRGYVAYLDGFGIYPVYISYEVGFTVYRNGIRFDVQRSVRRVLGLETEHMHRIDRNPLVVFVREAEEKRIGDEIFYLDIITENKMSGFLQL